MLSHPALGPVLSRHVDEAMEADPLVRSSWQYGVARAAQAFEQPRSAYGASQALVGAAVGVVAGVTFSGLPLVVQALLGGLLGLVVYWGVPTLWACGGSLIAPYKQRDEARALAQQKEEAMQQMSRNFAPIRTEWQERGETIERLEREKAELDQRLAKTAKELGAVTDTRARRGAINERITEGMVLEAQLPRVEQVTHWDRAVEAMKAIELEDGVLDWAYRSAVTVEEVAKEYTGRFTYVRGAPRTLPALEYLPPLVERLLSDLREIQRLL